MSVMPPMAVALYRQRENNPPPEPKLDRHQIREVAFLAVRWRDRVCRQTDPAD